jgi:hypothetical protein
LDVSCRHADATHAILGEVALGEAERLDHCTSGMDELVQSVRVAVVDALFCLLDVLPEALHGARSLSLQDTLVHPPDLALASVGGRQRVTVL